MEDVARRVTDAQAAEKDLVTRISQARMKEEDASREVQRKAEEHSKAQLELRRLDLLSAKSSVSNALHEQARRNENSARQQLEKARADREESSRVRAVTEGELNRIKAELTEKNANGQARIAQGAQQTTADFSSYAAPVTATPDLVAPADAIVEDVFAQAGAWVQANQQLISLAPDAGALEATAWFPENEGVNIQPGQSCRIYVMELPNRSFSGKVERVLPVGSLTPKSPLGENAKGRQLPVRVRFAAKDADAHAVLKPGMRAAVRIHYVTPLWTHSDTLSKKTGASDGKMPQSRSSRDK